MPLIVELRIRSSDPIHDLVFNPARHTCQDVDQAVRVRGNEIDWRIARAEPVHRCGDGQPPAACVAREPEVAAAYEAKHDAAFVALDRREVGVETFSPRFMQAAPVVGRRTRGLPGVFIREIDILQQAVQLVPFDLERNKRRHEVVDV